MRKTPKRGPSNFNILSVEQEPGPRTTAQNASQRSPGERTYPHPSVERSFALMGENRLSRVALADETGADVTTTESGEG